MFDLATHVVSSHNETMRWCKSVYDDGNMTLYVYRPMTDIVASRNAFLTQTMHYRSHQLEI